MYNSYRIVIADEGSIPSRSRDIKLSYFHVVYPGVKAKCLAKKIKKMEIKESVIKRIKQFIDKDTESYIEYMATDYMMPYRST